MNSAGTPVARSGVMPRDRSAILALGQGLYYLVTGVWPLVSLRTFEAVTGPKVDRWLVKTVGVLVSVIGGVLLLAGRRRRVEPEPALLAAASAAGLAAIDTVYATRGRISKIYLLDAVVEVALVAAWVAATGASRTTTSLRRAA
jgi:hypothetical protein